MKAIFFAQGARVDSPQGLALVRAWGEAGHDLANHTYRHRNFGARDVLLQEFITDIQRNQDLLEDLPGFVRRFRYPYLKEGDTAAKQDGLRDWLAAAGYASGAVSIDTSDWYYNSRYLRWRNRNPDADVAKMRDAYLEHLLARARYYDGLSRQLLDRSVRHVLLLHMNGLNAEFLPDVIAMFRANGWRIITPAEAYADPVYVEQPDILPAGESILWSLAQEKGMEGLRYPSEDSTYEKDRLDALGF